MNYYQIIENLYLELGVLKNTLNPNCRFSNICWNGINEDRIPHDYMAQLSRPFIGRRYNEGKILTLGINFHEYGGYNAEIRLTIKACEEIKGGKRKTFAKAGYPGSLVWHRFLSYATFILRETGLIEMPPNRPYPEKDELIKAFDFIAATNSIKCCPWSERSKPTNDMWNHCPNFILKEEINLLMPKHIVILGVGNYNRIKNIFNVPHVSISDGETRLIKTKFLENEMSIYVFPHPSSSKGTSIKRMDELEHLLMKEYKN